MHLILDVQLLSELESLAAVPAEMESNQEYLHEEGMFLVAEVNINDLFWRCSLCGNPIIHTDEKTREHFYQLDLPAQLGRLLCVQLESGVYLFGERFVMLVS